MENEIIEIESVNRPFIIVGNRREVYEASQFCYFGIKKDTHYGKKCWLVYGITRKPEKQFIFSKEETEDDARCGLGMMIEHISRSANFYFPIEKE
jgi:hypothetical protein